MVSPKIPDNRLKDQGPSEVAAGNCGDAFPDVVTLTDNPEDQEVLLRVQAVWVEYSSGWGDEMNLDTPSKHKLYNSVELDFAIWVLLKCIYPEQPLPTLKALLVAKYPGLDLTSFVGPRLTPEGNEIKFVRVKKTKKTKKAKTTDSPNAAKPTPRVPERIIRGPGQPRPGERSLKSKLSKIISKETPTGHESPKGSAKDRVEFDKDLMSHFECLERSVGDGPTKVGLSGEQFKELKNRVLEAIMATHRDLVKEMHKANAETIKEIQNMQTKLDGGLVNGRENLGFIASEVSNLRAAVEVVRREQKDIHR
ncbi:hypothetical protein FGRMN_2008 [Fusarium graminum]|nr:hypothetical protein FGRMN_2008 [Fusarium graminum]